MEPVTGKTKQVPKEWKREGGVQGSTGVRAED